MPSTVLPQPKDSRSSDSDKDRLYEVVNGVEVEVPHMGKNAALVASELAYYLRHFAAANKLGFVAVETLFRFAADRPQRRPDVAFISSARAAAAPTLSDDDPPAWEVVPNIAVEVISPTNTVKETNARVQEYFDAGVESVWVVDPASRRVDVYESPTKVRIHGPGDTLDGKPVLAGFQLKLADLFAVLNPR